MSENLTSEQIEELKCYLLAQRDQLRRKADEELRNAREQPYRKLAGDVHDKGDESIADQVAGLEAELADRRTVELHSIDTALQRIDEGSYGICIDCGRAIAFERLKAYPMAQRCIDCKTKYEKQHSGVGIPSL